MLLYQRIAKHLQALISRGEFNIDGKLPSERDLVTLFVSTRITVRDALLRLEAEGIIYRRQRKGWFVCPKRLIWDPSAKVNFYALAQEQGFRPQTQVLLLGPLQQAQYLDKVWLTEFGELNLTQLVRKRFLDNRPVMLEEIHFSSDKFPNISQQDLNGSITDIMAKDYGIIVASETSMIWVTTLPDEYSQALETNNGAACLKIIRRRFDKTDALVDINVEYWLHSALQMTVNSH
ncbi:MAG: DNA-binding GntR family transcriptional regulator [Shewanella sp.]|jgi:DNA-binding GntR family transcriptional regulator